MEKVERTQEEMWEDEIAYELEKLHEIEPGTDKHSKATEDIVKLYRAKTDNYKVECEIYNQSQRIENEKKRDEVEADIKRLQIDIEESRFNRVRKETIISVGTTVVLTGAMMWYEAKGYIFPAKILQNVPKIKLFT